MRMVFGDIEDLFKLKQVLFGSDTNGAYLRTIILKINQIKHKLLSVGRKSVAPSDKAGTAKV